MPKAIMNSVLDRLIDNDPDKKDPEVLPRQAYRALHDAVLRDLEALLNTRYRCADPPEGLAELEKSLANYGLPDFTGANFGSDNSKEDIRRAIKKTIENYEPRFKSGSVRIHLLENSDELDRTIRFRIEAVLLAEPAPEHVIFDSLLEPVTRNVQVKARANG